MNQMVEIAYIGSLAAPEIACGRHRIQFINRKPRAVNSDVAERLLKQKDFCRADELVITMEEKIRGGYVLVKRWGALGDLLMLRAVISAFQRQSPQYRFGLWCDERWEDVFASDRLWDVVNPANKDTPQSISFDQVAEQDHRGGESQSRIDLMMSILTQKQLDLTEADWRIPAPDHIKKDVDAWMASRRPGPSHAPLIGMQVRGSGLMKQLPDRQIRSLAGKLTALGDVVLIEHERERTWEAPGIYSMPGRSVLHSIELLRRCDLCVCFDSGVLWMAHAAPCKVLCVMGPTRPEQRLTKHPLYPSGGARAFKLNDIVQFPNGKRGCPACFEKADACKQHFTCMQGQPDHVVDLIAHEAELVLNGTLPLPVVS